MRIHYISCTKDDDRDRSAFKCQSRQPPENWINVLIKLPIVFAVFGMNWCWRIKVEGKMRSTEFILTSGRVVILITHSMKWKSNLFIHLILHSSSSRFIFQNVANLRGGAVQFCRFEGMRGYVWRGWILNLKYSPLNWIFPAYTTVITNYCSFSDWLKNEKYDQRGLEHFRCSLECLQCLVY